MALCDDGKIIIAGDFTQYNGVPRNKIARLNLDGSLDTAFNPLAGIGTGEDLMIAAVAVQNDGKIIIAGNFTSYNGTAINRIARLNSNGSLDTGFDPGTGASGEDDVISCIAIQSDGKIIAGGFFSSFNDEQVKNIVRLTSTGAVDKYFAANSIPEDEDDPVTYSFPNNAVSSIGIQSDGKIVIGGSFNSCGLYSRNKLARFNSDGTFDTGFSSSIAGAVEIYSIAIQSDDKILAGGSGRYFARFNSNGTLDTLFSPYDNASDDDIYGIALQADGKILLSGIFDSYNTIPCKNLIRLNSNGTVDTDFKTEDGANDTVICMVVLADGNILIGGAFTMYEGVEKGGIVRILK